MANAKRTRRRKTIGGALLAGTTLFLGGQAGATTWTTTTPTGDSGTWSDSTKWGGNVPDVAGETAVFGAYANDRTITVDNSIYTVDSLTITPRTSGFSAKGFTLNSTGGGSLAIGSGGVTIDNGGTAAVNVAIEVTADQIWNALSQPSGNANFTGVISGVGKISRSSTGGTGSTFTFTNANTFSGGFTQAAGNSPITRLGVSSTVGGGVIADGPLGTGTITLNGGVITSNSGTARILHNNVVIGGAVIFGNSATTGALTFSDVGLSTASTFTLGAGAMNVIRAAGTSLVFDQVIAESGGTGQSVNFTSTSGTPTVTLNRTKTAGGNILVGGVTLVLANGSAQSGSIIGVNGSASAIGANRFSAGALISDNMALLASDSTNYSDISGGQARTFNNARVSFVTEQSQAVLEGLFTADSSLRLGLGSGSGNATVTQNYDQSALGNGLAGLVSASTGTITYNGTLTSGIDSAYRLGGGAGTLSLTVASALTGSRSLIVEGGGTLSIGAAQNYTGATTVNSNLTLQGPAATINGSSAVAINNSTLSIDNTGGSSAATDRFNNAATITMNRGVLSMINNGTGTPPTEEFGGLVINAGANAVNLSNAPTGTKTISVNTLARNNNALLTVRGDAFGTNAGSSTNRNILKVTGTAPTVIGGDGAAGTTTISIVPWTRGGFSGGASFAASSFATFDTASQSFRVLNATTEFVQANNNTTARVDQAIATAGGASNYNVRSTPNTTGGATLVNTASSSVTVNSFLFDNTGATAANTYGLNGSTLTVTSGAVHVQHAAAQNITLNNGTIAFGAAEGVLTNNTNGYLTTIGTQISGSGGLSIYNLNGGGLQLGSVTTAGFSGGLTFGGNGFIGVDQDQRFGASTNSVTHAGGELRFFAGFTSVRDLVLLPGVGDNTLGNNSTSTVTWNGNISGGGRLRLINNSFTPSGAGFNLGGSNSYSGGSSIEGVAVNATTNNALGTGTVTLLNANSNFTPTLILSGSAPTLGGLRGTDGVVNINPAASAATLTIGANNDSTVFNGVIAQGAGKTGSLVKTGTGTLVLGSNSTYGGSTQVLNGALIVNGSIASGGVTVENDATLGGSGSIGGSVSVAGGGTLAPGNSAGQITVGGGLALASNAKLAIELDKTAAHSALGAQVAGVDYDQVVVASENTIDVTGGVLQLSLGDAILPTEVYYILDNRGTGAVTGEFAGGAINGVAATGSFAEGGTFAAGDLQFSISYLASAPTSSAGNDVALTVVSVPEPAALGLLAVGATGLLCRRRRRICL